DKRVLRLSGPARIAIDRDAHLSSADPGAKSSDIPKSFRELVQVRHEFRTHDAKIPRIDWNWYVRQSGQQPIEHGVSDSLEKILRARTADGIDDVGPLQIATIELHEVAWPVLKICVHDGDRTTACVSKAD